MKKTLLYVRYAAGALLVFMLFFTMGSAISVYVKASSTAEDNTPEDLVLVEEDGERTNILVLGVDARPGDENARSDTMLLISIDPKLDKAAVISIPRDTRVDVPGSPLDKICTANYAGGPEYAVEIVEDFMNINIDYYVEADFNGFKEVIDTIGGVTINVPQRMYKPSEGIDLYPGTQKLDGYKALAFVRYRGYEFGDIERAGHQQEFLIALADELLKPKTITKLPTLIKEVRSFVKTDIGLTQMLRMASWAPGFTSSSIVTQTLPGYFYDVYNAQGVMEQSYWVADREAASSLIDNMFEGKTVAVIKTSPYPVYVPPPEEDVDAERSNLPSPADDTGPGYENDNEQEDELDAGGWQGHWEDEAEADDEADDEESWSDPNNDDIGSDGYI
ncbi:cell envelope-associated transcriptional attenuator lytr-cpsa-psr, subfamily m [hydrocarbon metagenome]|uniref:Cell envelope-associated transcriptional attenuator lytr-cpsa-psr, subfamily m n=1 Tax=hydrocarbon metagenome TaxID=938273 RepID=A0A0W8E910_9ZZZZ